jgi:hypothetical protein
VSVFIKSIFRSVTKLLRALGKKRGKYRLIVLLGKLRRSGFVDILGGNRRRILVHPWFVRDRRDLLTNFTYRDEFLGMSCTLGIDVPGEKPCKSDKLKLELFDLGTRLFDLHNACLDLNDSIADAFQCIKMELESSRDEQGMSKAR